MTDNMLMQEVKQGNLARAALLFERHHRRMYYFLGKLSGDYVQAEDLTQTVFEKMIMYRHTFDSSLTFDSWLFRIARNCFIDHINKQKKRPIVLGMEHHLADLPENSEDESEDRQRRLYQAMEVLELEDKELLVLSRFEKMKYQDIAALKGITETNVKVKIYRALEKLRTTYFKLEKQGL